MARAVRIGVSKERAATGVLVAHSRRLMLSTHVAEGLLAFHRDSYWRPRFAVPEPLADTQLPVPAKYIAANSVAPPGRHHSRLSVHRVVYLAPKRPCGRLKTFRYMPDRASHRRAGARQISRPLAFFRLGLFGGLHVDVVIEEPA